MLRLSALAAATSLAAAVAAAQDATATLRDAAGEEIGTATLAMTESGLTFVAVTATGIPEGEHGVHVHETGDCSAPDFASAGGHLSGGHDHGVMVATGPHAGDMPNAHVEADGVLAVEAFVVDLPLDLVLDEDGAALVIHAGPDDYVSQPSGEAGDRIACGVFEAG